jgi:hypothetical protein
VAPADPATLHGAAIDATSTTHSKCRVRDTLGKGLIGRLAAGAFVAVYIRTDELPPAVLC